MEVLALRRRLGANIKVMRRKKGFSQEKLAELVGVSTQTVTFIEGGRSWVSDKTLVNLAKALNTDVVQLFTPQVSENFTNDDPQNQSIVKLKEDLIAYINTRFAALTMESGNPVHV